LAWRELFCRDEVGFPQFAVFRQGVAASARPRRRSNVPVQISESYRISCLIY